jgi:hypothetical protein
MNAGVTQYCRLLYETQGASKYVRIVSLVSFLWLNPVKREGFTDTICISAPKCDPATFLLRLHSRRIRY